MTFIVGCLALGIPTKLAVASSRLAHNPPPWVCYVDIALPFGTPSLHPQTLENPPQSTKKVHSFFYPNALVVGNSWLEAYAFAELPLLSWPG